MKKEIKNKYTLEQFARFNELYQKLVEIDKTIDKYMTNGALQHPSLKKRIALLALGEYLPNYEREVPEEVREAFGFDKEGLVKKVNDLLN